MQMRYKAFSLPELLAVLGIALIGYLSAMPLALSFMYRMQAVLTMRQIELAVNYGRSIAIAHSIRVTICPSTNHLTCSSDWQDAILVSAANGKKSFFKIYINKYAQLNMRQSGFNRVMMVIEGSGMTNHNGSFNYKSLKYNSLPQFNLYFNKALRLYMQSDWNGET